MNGSIVIFPELSYKITGLLFSVHNKLGRWSREKQYADSFEEHCKEAGLQYKREYRIGHTGNILDFIIEEKVILEFKAKGIITKEDFRQAQRYLQATGLKLCLLVNFKNTYLKPIRIIKIDNPTKKY